MALLFMDGFDASDHTLKYNAYSASGRRTNTTTTRFNSGGSLAISKDIADYGFIRKYIPATSELYIGFAFMQTVLNSMFIRLWGDATATTHITVSVASNGTINVQRGATTIASSAAGLITANRWYYIETKTTINDTTGSFILKVNGVEVINFTGDTKNAGTANSIDMIELIRASGSDGSNYYDDLYVCDATGSAPYNTFLNEIRIHSLVPNAAGSSTQFTPSAGANYTTVDELPYSATDYVRAGTTGQRDTYQFTDLPAAAGNVLAVQNTIIAKKTDAAVIGLKPAIKSGASVYYGSTVNLGGTDDMIYDLRIVDPATGTAWSASGVNSLEAGFEVA